MKKIYAIIIALTAAGLLFAWFGPFGGKGNTGVPANPAARPEPVKVTVVSDTAAARLASQASDSSGSALRDESSGYFTGVVEPAVDVKLGLSVQGRIQEILCREGQRVARGTPLVSLERSLEALEVSRRKLIWQNRAEVDAAESAASIMTEMLKMNRALYDETHSISREDLDQMTMQCQRAISDRDRLRMQEQREKAEYDQAVEAFDARMLRAPDSGIVEKVFVKQGESYQQSQPLVRLVETGRCVLVLNLDDAARYGFRKGMPVDLEISNGKEQVKRRGIVAHMPETVDPASGVRQMKVWFDNRDGSVMPGVMGRMRIPERK